MGLFLFWKETKGKPMYAVLIIIIENINSGEGGGEKT